MRGGCLLTVLCVLLFDGSLADHKGRPLYDYENCGLPTTKTNERRKRSDDMDYKDYGFDEEDNANVHTKILGGDDAEVGHLPWAVAMRRKTTHHESICGGSLVTSRHVVTAAHCFGILGKQGCGTPETEENLLNQINIYAGGVCLLRNDSAGCTRDKMNTKYKIVKVSGYQKYFKNSCNHKHDIAIIELEKDVVHPARQLCLPYKHNFDKFDAYTSIYHAAGYGYNPRIDTMFSARLQVVTLGTEDMRCKEEGKVRGVICTMQEEIKNVCRGDSGSGIYTIIDGRAYLKALVSSGTGCADMLEDPENIYGYGFNTDIMFYQKLINKATGLSK